MHKVKTTLNVTFPKCPDCGSELVMKYGRYGSFVGCSSYPNCKFVLRSASPQPVTTTESDKMCSACKAVKPLSMFYNKIKAPDGKQSRCIECYKKPVEYYESLATKLCTKCGRDLPMEEYNKCTSRPDGRQTACKACVKHYPSAVKRYNDAVARGTARGVYQRPREIKTTVDLYTDVVKTPPDLTTNSTNGKSVDNLMYFLVFSLGVLAFSAWYFIKH
jgi:ssDNA-binding Zn-finger/Zn-ribbon topoisomerase 1